MQIPKEIRKKLDENFFCQNILWFEMLCTIRFFRLLFRNSLLEENPGGKFWPFDTCRIKYLIFSFCYEMCFQYFHLVFKMLLCNICCGKNLLLKRLKSIKKPFQRYLEHFQYLLSTHHSDVYSQQSEYHDANLDHSIKFLPLHLLTMESLWRTVYKTNSVFLAAGKK